MQGKAAVFTTVGTPFEINDVPVPAVESGAVLVRVTLANICGSDLHMWRGSSYVRPMPTILGHEMCGVVAELGAGVTTDSMGEPLAVGDRVTYAYFYPCGRCHVCVSGNLAACPNKMKQRRGRSKEEPIYWFGAYAEYYYLRPGHYIFKVSDDLSDEMVAPVNCALAQVMYSLHQARINYGDTVVVQGAGGLGVNATAVAREMGAGRVIVIDKFRDRLALASDFGAHHLIDINEYPTPEDRIARVKELTGGKGADVVGEFVGSPAVVPEGIAMLRSGGSYLLVGNINENLTVQFDPSTVVNANKHIIGVGTYEPWAIAKSLQLIQKTKDKYPFGRILSHKFPLAQINEAFTQAEEGKVTRAAIIP
jgi:D-arabinose 1-dehydrogenase-like Zn-dependent alcohol dehydrogenase